MRDHLTIDVGPPSSSRYLQLLSSFPRPLLTIDRYPTVQQVQCRSLTRYPEGMWGGVNVLLSRWYEYKQRRVPTWRTLTPWITGKSTTSTRSKNSVLIWLSAAARDDRCVWFPGDLISRKNMGWNALWTMKTMVKSIDQPSGGRLISCNARWVEIDRSRVCCKVLRRVIHRLVHG